MALSTRQLQAQTPWVSPTVMLVGSLFEKTPTRIAAAAILVIVVLALLADQVVPFDPIDQNLSQVLHGPAWPHVLGTDDLGRDVLSRVVLGSRVSLAVGMVAVGIAALLGVCVGVVAGYRGGSVDNTCMRIVESVQAFPALLLALTISAALGPSLLNSMIAIGVVYSPTFARLARAQTLATRHLDFVTAAQALGAGDLRITMGHILPNISSPVTVQIALSISFAMLTEASLSFLGAGVQPPTPSWGAMLRSGYGYLERAPWIPISAGAAIFLAVLSFNTLGEGLRQALLRRS